MLRDLGDAGEHRPLVLSALRATGLGDLEALTGALEAVNVYLVGAVRKEITERRAERSSGLDRRQFQHATGPYLTRRFATGNYPALADWVHNGRHRTAAEVFDLGLTYLLDGIRSRLG
jgi:hypothetical protein